MFFKYIIPLFIILCYTGCVKTNIPGMPVQVMNSGQVESIMASGNLLDFYIEGGTKPYRCSLNPGMIKTKRSIYYILNFQYNVHPFPFEISTEDSLRLFLDGSEIGLPLLTASRKGDRITANFSVNKWDLLDIGNAGRVQVSFQHKDTLLNARLSARNIYAFKYFGAKYIIRSTDIPVPAEPAYERPWGFLGVGQGSGYEFWFAYYTDSLKTTSGWGEYIALGAGFSPFDYWRYNHYVFFDTDPPVVPEGNKEYWFDGAFTENSYYINLMYGLSHPIPFGRWSIEAGVTFQYYFYNQDWNPKGGSLSYPTLYEIKNGEPYEGAAVGGFIQIGGLWFLINSKSNWAVGLTIPTPWW